ncbi:MAG: hypothetical protein ABJO29_03200 [Yoonia sp.]|uniref:hypothetical protein n=1 Tax=Yoonia sp. TaxID=2212373 RepID=UPI0032641FED
MKRRGFLQALGAAVTAPFVPLPALARTATAAPYSAAAVHAAIYHAKSRSVFSVWGLAKATNMTPDQAVAVMEHLAERGVLGPLQGTTHGGRWASSNIMQSQTLAKARAARVARELQVKASQTRKLHFDIDLTKLTARLRTIQARYESQQPLDIA